MHSLDPTYFITRQPSKREWHWRSWRSWRRRRYLPQGFYLLVHPKELKCFQNSRNGFMKKMPFDAKDSRFSVNTKSSPKLYYIRHLHCTANDSTSFSRSKWCMSRYISLTFTSHDIPFLREVSLKDIELSSLVFLRHTYHLTPLFTRVTVRLLLMISLWATATCSGVTVKSPRPPLTTVSIVWVTGCLVFIRLLWLSCSFSFEKRG